MNGDAYLVEVFDRSYRLAVIDGLGHGPIAATAAEAAVGALRGHSSLDPALCLEFCREPLRRTRGAAISVVVVDTERQRLSFAGIGNVEARLLGPERERRLVPQRGIAGTFERRVRTTEVELHEPWLLVLYSDGISGRFELDAMPVEDLLGPPSPLAERLLRDWGRYQDDATVVVARPKR